MAAKSEAKSALGTVLVTGGCGFIGFHIVKALLKEPGCGPIHVLSRHPNVNIQESVNYHSCDISDSNQVEAAFREIRPNVVFHAASPRDTNTVLKSADFSITNIGGTENLLDSAGRTSTKAFVLTSSTGVYSGRSHLNKDEESPVWQLEDSDASPYEVSKVAAERIVLAASKHTLPTVALRICSSYGERDNQMVPNMLPAVYAKQTNVQFGNNTSFYDFLYAGNAAKAHILAAKALLDPKLACGKVAGEVFNITDGKAVHFWDHARLIWRAAGDKIRLEDVWIIPPGLVMTVTMIVEWLYRIFTLGRVRPIIFNTKTICHFLRPHTFSIDKARERLGYDPVPEWEGGIKRSVQWEVEKQRKEGKHL